MVKLPLIDIQGTFGVIHWVTRAYKSQITSESSVTVTVNVEIITPSYAKDINTGYPF